MGQFPSKVKNVSVYPYINWPEGGGIGPVLLPLLTGASGTYTVGTLGLQLYYNLQLSGGELQPKNGKIEPHGKYTAMGEFEDGRQFSTPVWLYCLNTTPDFLFGRTIIPDSQTTSAVAELSAATTDENSIPPYGKLTPLSNITVTQVFDTHPLVIPLIKNGKGYVIYTKVGTPHLMGVLVETGDKINPLHAGMSNIIITGTKEGGEHYSITRQVCYSNALPAVFLSKWP